MMDYTDDVRGIVVGGDTLTLYKFYTVVPPGVDAFLGSGVFQTDEEAEEHARTHYPAAYARGIEMRVFDCRAAIDAAEGEGERSDTRSGGVPVGTGVVVSSTTAATTTNS